MNTKSRTIHIEGLDLAGKSTICRKIVEIGSLEKRNNSLLEPGANRLHGIAEEFRKVKGALSASDLGWMYYGALLADLRDYRPSKTPLVQDSTLLLRSIAYHSVFGDASLARKLRELLPVHPRFAFSCLLTTSDEVRLSRLEGRIGRGNDRPEDYIIRENPAGFHEMENILKDLVVNEFDGKIIDSSTLEQDGEQERIARFILENADVR